MLLIYSDEKFPLFIPSKDEILVPKMPTSLHEKKTGWRQWAIIFRVDVKKFDSCNILQSFGHTILAIMLFSLYNKQS